MNVATFDLPLRESVRAIFPKPDENRIEKPALIREKVDSAESNVDSGYASRNSNSPDDFNNGGRQTLRKSDTLTDESTPTPINRAGLNIHRGGLFPRKKRLIPFPQKEIPPETYKQFQNVRELVKRALADALYQCNPSSRPVVIQLINLGEDEATANPFIVIICDKAAGAKARQLIKEKWYKEHCRDRDGKRLPLRTVVDDQNGGATFCNLDRLPVFLPEPSGKVTSFGRLLRFQDGEEKHMVTLGGIVRVRDGLEDRMYALTCGHHLYQPEEDSGLSRRRLSESAILEPSEDVVLGNEDPYSDDETEYEIAWVGRNAMTTAGDDQSVLQNDHVEFKDLPTGGYGKIVASSYETGALRPNLDWALVELEPQDQYLSIVREFYWKASNAINADADTRNRNENSTSSISTDVIVLAGRTGIHSGTLSQESSLFLAPGSHDFIEVHSIRSLDAPLNSGDSGAWVVDKATRGIHGQIIATGPFAQCYVVLLPPIERCIENQLKVDSVSVASEQDVQSWLERRDNFGTNTNTTAYQSSPSYHFEYPLPGYIVYAYPPDFSTMKDTAESDPTKPPGGFPSPSLRELTRKTPRTPFDSGYASKMSSRRTSPRTSHE